LTKPTSAEVVVVGGGVIGCSIAHQLALAGASVALVERGQLASGASGVAAGMLAPQVEAPFADAFFELSLAGRASHAPLAEQLRDEVGLDVEYRATGILRVARTEAERVDLQRMQRWQKERGLRAEWIEPAALGECEPLLAGVAGRLLAGGLWLPDEAQVRSPRLVQALADAAVRHGARVYESTWATSIEPSGGRVGGVRTQHGVISADTVVLAAGVWSSELLHTVGLDLPLAPVKGQIISLQARDNRPRQVIWSGECYLVPRVDGQIVLGATEEEGNYDARPTLAGVGRLTEAVLEFLPAAGALHVEGAWAGLRPAVPDRRPVVGLVPGFDNLVLATAHYRNGVLLGPLTAQAVADLILRDQLPQAWAPFGVDRFLSSSSPSSIRSSANSNSS
jgi:glycine oxidase